jgi:tRNA pseudouridine55 synthase
MTTTRTFDFLNGEILLINKPKGWTSFAVVNHLRKFICSQLNIKKIKVGHAGTLDPMATGLLILCTGKFTKRMQEFTSLDKTYKGTFILGANTPTFDAESEVDQTYSINHITPSLLESTRQHFIGTIRQTPPPFSAVKIAGKPAYAYARKNKAVIIESREITIYKFDLTSISLPEIAFEVDCSKGTYIRSLVHDYGKALSCGAYLSSLTRTRIGPYHLSEAYEINHFKEIVTAK